MMSMFLLLMLIPDVGCRARRYAEERIIHAAEPVEEHHLDGAQDSKESDASEHH